MKPIQKALKNTLLVFLATGCLIVSVSSDLNAQQGRDKRKQEIDSNYTVKLRDGIELRGTYITPTKNMPLLILVQPPMAAALRHFKSHTRRGMFRTLAESLSELGFGVFWFDNRGLGFSEGNSDSTTLYTQARDVQDVLKHLKKRNPKRKIGLIGHSEGGCVSEVVASSDAPETRVDLLILLSTPYLEGYESFRFQIHNIISDQPDPIKNARTEMDARIMRVYPRLFDILEISDNTDTLKKLLGNEIKKDLEKYPSDVKEAEIHIEKSLYENWTHPQQIALRKFKPGQYLTLIKCPILALCGEKDRLLECAPHFRALESILTKTNHPDFTAHSLPLVDHAYHTLKDSAHYERAYKNEGFSEVAFRYITDWLMQRL